MRITGLLVVVMNVLMADRNPESSSKITSTSSNKISDVADFLLCSSFLFFLRVDVTGDLVESTFPTFFEAARRNEIKWGKAKKKSLQVNHWHGGVYLPVLSFFTVLGSSLLVGWLILKKFAKETGARPPLLAALGDWGCFLGEETTLRGELAFPEKHRSILIHNCTTYRVAQSCTFRGNHQTQCHQSTVRYILGEEPDLTALVA